jgi:hypothetical protein
VVGDLEGLTGLDSIEQFAGILPKFAHPQPTPCSTR